MKECIICNSNLIEDKEYYCLGCIKQNNQIDHQIILRLKKQLPKMLAEIYLKKYFENINLINKIEVIEVEE